MVRTRACTRERGWVNEVEFPLALVTLLRLMLDVGLCVVLNARKGGFCDSAKTRCRFLLAYFP